MTNKSKKGSYDLAAFAKSVQIDASQSTLVLKRDQITPPGSLMQKTAFLHSTFQNSEAPLVQA